MTRSDHISSQTAPVFRQPAQADLPWWGWALRRVLICAFWAFSRTVFDVHVRGLEHFTNQPATLVVANHKSDFDAVVLFPTLYWAFRGRGPTARSRFVAAESMFEPSYVSMYLMRYWPHWARRLLYPANLSAVLKALGAYPIPGSPSRKLNTHLRALLNKLADQPLGDLFDQPVADVFPGTDDTTTIRDVLRWRWHAALDQSWRLSGFTHDWAHAAKAIYLEDIQASLDHFTAALARGDDVFIAPEGMLESDGQFAGVKAGVSRLVRGAGRQVTLLPVNITYENMTTARSAVFVSIGQEVVGVEQWPRQAVEQHTARAIVAMNTITLQQLVAGALADTLQTEPRVVHEKEFTAGLFDQARALHVRGMSVDNRLLHGRTFDRRWQQFVAYCQRRKLARRLSRQQILFEAESLPADATHQSVRCGAWRYCANELRSAMHASAQTEHWGESTAEQLAG